MRVDGSLVDEGPLWFIGSERTRRRAVGGQKTLMIWIEDISVINKTADSFIHVCVHVCACLLNFDMRLPIEILWGWVYAKMCKYINLLNAELNPISHLLALLGAHHILHVSRTRVNKSALKWLSFDPVIGNICVLFCGKVLCVTM